MATDYKRMFELAGIKVPGQTVKVYGGRHDKLVAKIIDINFNEGEVLLTTKKDYDRWFSVAMVTCLDPQRAATPLVPTTAPLRGSGAISPALPTPNPIAAPAPRTEPSTTAPSWMPKRIL